MRRGGRVGMMKMMIVKVNGDEGIKSGSSEIDREGLG